MRVLHPRENLAFGEEAAAERGPHHAYREKLDCHGLIEGSVGALREIHAPHPAVAEQTGQPIGSNEAPCPVG